MLTPEQQLRLKEIEEMLARIAKGTSATETLSLTNRITEAFEEYRSLRSLGTERQSKKGATPHAGEQS